MQAKIMLLPAGSKGKTLCSYAEELLLEISADFGHSLNTCREKIGADSIRLFDVPLTQETLDSCKKCQAVFLADSDCEGSRALYQGLNIPLRIRHFSIPASLCERSRAAQTLLLGQVISLEQNNLFLAVREAMKMANDLAIPFCHTAPTGNNRFQWEADIKETARKYPNLPCESLSAPEAVRRLIETPEKAGFMLCPPYAGSMLESAASCLFPFPGIQYDTAIGEEIGVYAPRLHPDATDIPSPFGTAFAVAELLKHSLHMQREGACLEAAIHNVLAAGWRTPGMPAVGQVTDGSHIIQLICDQLAVAGEFLFKGKYEV